MLQQSNKFLFICSHCLLDGIQMLYLTNYSIHENFIDSLIDGHGNMSDMMCHDGFVGSQMFHSSHVHFRVRVRVCVVSCDTIEHGMTWKRILLHSHGIHVHTGFMCALSHGFT